ncbi:RES domain-containing protein [uncultured Brevibacillus sp.]|uniref:RES domain-containing protein n=1 Tax=uncultured Brevibacillus sp. TaxID=169970 RepID=UPI0025997CD6|nr:RES domain-containing protein [uncultured Brevibacillus sp.]
MRCCVNCFSDLYLIIKISEANEVGDCDYCESQNLHTVDVGMLTEHFEKLMGYYEFIAPGEHYIPEIHSDPTEYGEMLINLINEDWDIFSREIEGSGTDGCLLFDILSSNTSDINLDSTALYSRITDAFSFSHPLEDWEGYWENFKKELKHNNRFFPQFKSEVFDETFNDVINRRKMYIAKNFKVYRARMGVQKREDMLAPPVEKATAGRANPRGISYLYCAKDEKTSIAEIRPWKGATVTVAEMSLLRELTLINLTGNITSPFIYESHNKLLVVVKLLKHFSNDLSKPVDPSKSEIEYLPTQYLTELIKSKGFDGIYFKSAMGPENNIVIFDETTVEIIDVHRFSVDDIAYCYSKKENS